MKRRILSLLLAAALLILALPMVAYAAEIAWEGGNPNHDHVISSTTYSWVNTSEHVATLNCSCGAYSSWTESHYDVKSSEITPGGPDYPNGGTIYYCPHCQKEWVVAKEPETCQHTSTTPKFDANSHWDECDNCHARLNESAHHLATQELKPGGSDYPYGAIVTYCEDIMRCKICDADDGNGIQVEEVADHDVQTETKTGPTTTHNDPDGEIMEVKSIEITITCKRCGKTLGHEWRTLVTTPKGNVYKLLIGKNTIPVSLHGGTHVTGQMGKDGGVYYRNEVNKAVEAEIKRLEKECAEVK